MSINRTVYYSIFAQYFYTELPTDLTVIRTESQTEIEKKLLKQVSNLAKSTRTEKKTKSIFFTLWY